MRLFSLPQLWPADSGGTSKVSVNFIRPNLTANRLSSTNARHGQPLVDIPGIPHGPDDEVLRLIILALSVEIK